MLHVQEMARNICSLYLVAEHRVSTSLQQCFHARDMAFEHCLMQWCVPILHVLSTPPKAPAV